MSSYIIQKESSEKKIIKVTAENYYSFTPKSAVRENITNITIYDYEKICKIVVRKLMIKYQKLMNLIAMIQQDGDSESNYALCLDEINKLYEMIEYKYKKYLKKELYDKFIEDLSNLKEFIVIGLEEKGTIRR